ncbi:hypothetical protein [Ornithinimicrobium avium]|uniref:Aminoglycoside phosphotransferase domain-containing protein n=1 Tax=Ornithinimicrobium avium TaxID=2283195 RepID=A0A345NMT3_9MICO|nr:hypothetical protein [Ornithinimicrobium avium]AXH96341.1 hypothetical protein DV701_09620 [Ornithinimicrobium avium]
MSAPGAPRAVPASVTDGGDVVTVARAWPGREDLVTVEGRDQHGRLRAGALDGTGAVRLLPYGTDGKLPALEPLVAAEAGGEAAELVVHRAGRRAVVRHAGGYTKVVRPGRAAVLAAASRTGGLLAAAAGLGAPQVLHEDRSTVTCDVLPGRPVHALSEEPSWDAVWGGWAAAWSRLQDLGAGAAEGLAPHTDEDEAEVLRTWARRAGDAGVLPGIWQERVEEVARRLEGQGTPVRLAPTHRDLHDKQLLWDGSTLGVLDLDTACLAAPEVDPANLAVHADLRRAQGLWAAGAAATVARTARDVALAGGAAPERLAAAELATVVRLACVYAFRPAWRGVVLEWAEARWSRPADEKTLIVVSWRSPAEGPCWSA